MSSGTRGKSPNISTMTNEEFWKNLPSKSLRLEMKKVVIEYLDELEKNGQINPDIKEKKSHHCKIACLLQKRKIGGWENMEYFHLKSGDYNMFKSLVDITNYEMKCRSAHLDSSSIAEAGNTPEKANAPATLDSNGIGSKPAQNDEISPAP